MTRQPPFFDFFIIGAQKAATSSLHRILNQHPEIYTSKTKELNFFLTSSDKIKNKAAQDHYLSTSNNEKRRQLSNSEIIDLLLADYDDEKIIGDSCPYYTSAPMVGSEAPQNIYQYNPQIKLIYVLRHPLARMVSNYLHDIGVESYYGRREIVGFNQRLQEKNHFLYFSLYHFQLERYLEFFPQAQIRLLFFEDFVQQPQKFMQDLTNFLEVEPYNFKTDVHERAATQKELFHPQELKFSAKNYQRLIPKIKADLKKLGPYLGRKLEWDLSRKTWQQKKIKNKQIKNELTIFKLERQLRYQQIELTALSQELETLKSSQLFKLWPLYNRLKQLLKN